VVVAAENARRRTEQQRGQCACGMALEGIVSKQRSSVYRAGRGQSWLKVKCTHREDFVVVGFTEPGGGRLGFGSLLLGYYDAAGKLHCAGKVGAGFNGKSERGALLG
jgi:bifunctional non-homologous end joining protein LigD